MEEMKTIRPHHGLCIRHFTGKGYSPSFVENMTRTIEDLNAGPEQKVRLRSRADLLCGSCPHRVGDGCTSGQKVLHSDAAVLELCGLEDGTVLSWRAFQRCVEERIFLAGRLESVCRGCQWLELCQSVQKTNGNKKKD